MLRIYDRGSTVASQVAEALGSMELLMKITFTNDIFSFHESRTKSLTNEKRQYPRSRTPLGRNFVLLQLRLSVYFSYGCLFMGTKEERGRHEVESCPTHLHMATQRINTLQQQLQDQHEKFNARYV